MVRSFLVFVCVANFHNINAGAFHQFTAGWVGWVGLWIFVRPFIAGAERFMFKYCHLESCGLSVLVLIVAFLLWFGKIFVGSVLVFWKLFSVMRFLYFNVVVLCTENIGIFFHQVLKS
jgi:hypothetical protein